MRSSRRRGGRRAAALVLTVVVAVLVVGVAAVLLSLRGGPDRGSDQSYALPTGLPATKARPVDGPDVALDALAFRDRAGERHALDHVDDHQQPFLAPPAPGSTAAPTLVVPPRATPYDLTEVAWRVPSAFSVLDDGALLLRNPLLVAPHAELVVDSETIPTLLLTSSGAQYAALRAVRSSLTLRGHPATPLTVGSYDPATGRRDENRHDGRSYVLVRGAAFTVQHATLSDLGFATTGETSGVAWTAAADDPATGGAFDTTFRRNYFGAYTAGAQGLVIARSAFLDNVIYGFDPHTATHDTLVTHSIAARNGRHGFIFSEGCDRNVVRDSEAYLNGGTGFMIDDGTPRHGRNRTADGNTLLRVSSHDNGDSGVVIEGGTGNAVRDAAVTNNEYGIWVRNRASETDLAGNRVTATQKVAVHLTEQLGPTRVTDTEVLGATVGVLNESGSATVMARNRTTIDTGPAAPFWTPWTLTSALHTAILLLWSAILVLPLASRLPLLRRWLARSRRAAPASVPRLGFGPALGLESGSG